jgi:hypothetical protein
MDAALEARLTGKTRQRWRESYLRVFGATHEGWEKVAEEANRLLSKGAVRSRTEALKAVQNKAPEDVITAALPLGICQDVPSTAADAESEGSNTAEPESVAEAGPVQADDPIPSSEGISESEQTGQGVERQRVKWIAAYRTVFGEEPDGQLAEARIRAAVRLYDPERSVGRKRTLEMVRESERLVTIRTEMNEQILNGLNVAKAGLEEDGEPEGEWLPLPDESALTLGAALVKIGRLEAEVEHLRRVVDRLEHQLHRTETRLGGLSPGLKALRDSTREARELSLKVSARVDTLAPVPSSGDTSTPPGKKELRELRARIDEERGRILLEVENRLDETEALIKRGMEGRIAALESWVRRISRYLGGGKGKGFR